MVRRLDPAVIEAEALGRLGWGDESTLAKHYLDVIAEALEAVDAS